MRVCLLMVVLVVLILGSARGRWSLSSTSDGLKPNPLSSPAAMACHRGRQVRSFNGHE